MKHRTAIVTAASVMIVIVAATAAIAANLGILANGTDTGEIGTLTVAASSVPEVPAASVKKVADPSPTSTSTSAPQQEAAPSGDISAYEVGDAGVVTLASDGSTLTIVNVEPNPGWQTAVIPSEVAAEVGFVGSDGTVLLFAAQLDATGTIQTIVQDLTSAPVTESATRSGDDDDHGSGDDDD